MKLFFARLAVCLSLPLVYLGVVLLAIFFVFGLTTNHFLLFLPLTLIIIGSVGYVCKEKKKGNY